MELPEIKSIEDITAKWSELQKNEAAAGVVTEYIKSQLVEKSKEFAAELAKKEELYKTVEANKNEAEKKAAELVASVEKLSKELAEVKAAQAAAEAQDTFNGRMAAFDEEFDLDDEDRSFLAEEIKNIESEESFAKYMAKQKKLMAGKKKKPADKKDPDAKSEPDPKDPKENKEDEGKCKASVPVVDVKEVVASITETPGQSVSNDPAPQVSLKDQMKEAFINKTTIGGKKLKK